MSRIDWADLSKLVPICVADGSSSRAIPTTLRANGTGITREARDAMLARVRGGEQVDLEIDLLAYEQAPGESNRNYVRFRDGAMGSLGRSGKGSVFLRDHRQTDVLARGGTVIASRTEHADKRYAIHQTVALTAPWAVEAALLGNLDRFSIGWNPTGPVLCSLCKDPIFETCFHLPGEPVELKGGATATVEWIFTEAELIETSAVSVPAVAGTHIEQVRAALTAAASTYRGRVPQRSRMERLIAFLGLSPTAGEDEAIKAVTSLRTERDMLKEARDTLAREHAALAVRVDTYEAQVAAQAVEGFVADAIREGKLVPGSKPEASLRKWFAVDPDAAREHVASMPAITPVGAPRQSAAPDAAGASTPALADVEDRLRRAGSNASVSGVRRALQLMGRENPDELMAKYLTDKGA